MLQKYLNRDTNNLMSLKRLGSRYPSRFSFSRSMLRRMIYEKWKLQKVKFDLDNEGYGTAVYEITIEKSIYSLVCFSQFLDDSERSDRVIAEKWDTAYTLHIGRINEKEINRLKQNIPLQEAGRTSSQELVLSRANKSVRLFENVVTSLSNGKQPNIKDINDVGYLLRTTAVYGSGKFGLSDFDRTKFATHFNQPFRAEMLAVYIIREFSIELVEHIAHHLNPKKAVKLDNKIKQHLGIGNSTGLGMAPFIIKHPKLIHQWIFQFEKAINKIKKIKVVDSHLLKKYIFLLNKSKKYLKEVRTSNEIQEQKNCQSIEDINKIINYIKKNDKKNLNWNNIINFSKNFCYDAQEIVKVQIVELYPNISDTLAENMAISEKLEVNGSMTLVNLIKLIERNYSWAIKTNFKKKNNMYLFWYVSEEKLEPRLGERFNENGAELEEPLGIGKMVYDLYLFIKKMKDKDLSLTVSEFLIKKPEFRGIVQRVQTLSKFEYGEVNDNILSKDILPIDMLRFKLSFFGASRYDPRSDKWLRVSFFSGAPFFKNLNKKNVENWGFATTDSYK